MLENFLGFYQFWRFPVHKWFTGMVRHYCYYYFKQYKYLKKEFETTHGCCRKIPIWRLFFFFYTHVGAFCFAKAGKKNKMLPDFRTAPLLIFIFRVMFHVCLLIRHLISPNQDDLSYSARTFISGHQIL